VAENLYKPAGKKLYQFLDVLSLLGTAGGPVMTLQGFLDKNYYFIGSGIILFGVSIAGHYLIEFAERQSVSAGLEKKLKKK